MKILLLLFLIILILLLTAAVFLVHFALDRNFPFHLIFSQEKGPDSFYEFYHGSEELQKEFEERAEEREMTSDDGLVLKAWFLKNEGHRYAFLHHGYTASHEEMITTAFRFLERGYNVLAVDCRAHGKSQGRFAGMGYPERRDARKWLEMLIEEDPKAQIVLFGHSMGAATVLGVMTDFKDEHIRCVVEDCGYGSVFSQFADYLKNSFHLPAFPLLYLASAYCKIVAGYSFQETDISVGLRKNEVPCLFIHGTLDSFVPYHFMEELYELDGGEKEKLSVEGASHCRSRIVATEEYDRKVNDFIDRYVSDEVQVEEIK